jgi:hypothetical protein
MLLTQQLSWSKLSIRIAKALTIASLTILSTTVTFNQPSYAQATTFFCGQNKGVPATMARTQRGDVVMVRWVSKYFSSNWSPQRRCVEVARRFQRSYDNGTLKTIISGTINGLPTICAAANSNDPCTNKTLLFTLKRGTNPSDAARRLMDIRGLASGNILNESSSDTLNLDFETYLNNAEVQSE